MRASFVYSEKKGTALDKKNLVPTVKDGGGGAMGAVGLWINMHTLIS